MFCTTTQTARDGSTGALHQKTSVVYPDHATLSQCTHVRVCEVWNE
jgi:hypothetical protein